MAEIGLVASAVGVVGFAGQITTGCLYLKTLLGQVKDGPAELGALWRELEIVNASTEDLASLWNRLKESGNVTIDPSAALQNCNQAVSTLTDYIKPFLLILSNPDSSITNTRRDWQKVKVALQRHAMTEKLENLNRAKQSLLEVQMNMSLAILDVEARNTRNLSSSLSQLATSSSASDNVLNQVLKIAGNTATEISKTHEVLDFLKAEVSTSNQTFQRVLSDTGGVGRIEAGVDALFEHMSTNIRTTADNFDGLQRQIRAEFASQAQSQRLLFSGLSNVINTSIQRALQNHRHELFSHNIIQDNSVIMNAEAVPPQIEAPEIGLKKPGEVRENLKAAIVRMKRNGIEKFTMVSRTIYQTPVCRIVTKTIHRQGMLSNDISKSTKAVLEVQLRVALLQKIFVFTRRLMKYGNNFDVSLRTCNIVPHDAPIIRAITELNLEHVQKLFESRHASPFDVNAYGSSLLVILFHRIQVLWQDFDKQRFVAFQKMVKYLVECGSQWNGSVLFAVHQMARSTDPEIQDLFVDSVRKIIAHATDCPMYADYSPPPASLLDLTASRSALGQMLLQQDYWVIDWDSCTTARPDMDNRIVLWENDRNILSDISGIRLQELANQTAECIYGFPFIYIVIRGSRLQSTSNQVLHELLILSSEGSDELRIGCLNRLVMLLKRGVNPRKTSIRENNHKEYKRQYSVTEFAIEVKRLSLWTEALTLAGWSEMEIMHLIDENLYFGFPELLNGDAKYVTHDECWVDFLTNLLHGGYASDTGLSDSWTLSTSLSCNLRTHFHFLYSTITASNMAFSLRTMPGSWPETGDTILRPGDNDEFDLQIARLLYYYKEEWLERYGYAEFVQSRKFLDWEISQPCLPY